MEGLDEYSTFSNSDVVCTRIVLLIVHFLNLLFIWTEKHSKKRVKDNEFMNTTTSAEHCEKTWTCAGHLHGLQVRYVH